MSIINISKKLLFLSLTFAFFFIQVQVGAVELSNESLKVEVVQFSDSSYCFKNLTDNTLIPFEFTQYLDNHTFFTFDFEPVKKNGYWGAIDMLGNVAIPFKYDKIDYVENSSLVLVNRNDKWGFYNIAQQREQIEPKFDIAKRFNNQNAIVCEKAEVLAGCQRKGKYGVIDSYNYHVIPPFYDDIEIVNASTFKVLLNNKYGLIDDKGQFIIDTLYSHLCVISDEIAIVEKDKKFGLINLKSKVVLIPFIYDKIKYLSVGIFIAEKADKQIFIDEYGKLLSNLNLEIYPNSGLLLEKYIVCKQGKKLGLLDLKLNVVLPFVFDQIISCTENGKYLIVSKNNSFGVYSKDLKEVLPPVFDFAKSGFSLDDQIFILPEAYITLKLNSETYILDAKGQLLEVSEKRKLLRLKEKIVVNQQTEASEYVQNVKKTNLKNILSID